jgi:hypothetical protein
MTVLAPGEPFFLRRRDHLAVDDESGSRVVVQSIDTENPHVASGSRAWGTAGRCLVGDA